jgi:hypothetical protein
LQKEEDDEEEEEKKGNKAKSHLIQWFTRGVVGAYGLGVAPESAAKKELEGERAKGKLGLFARYAGPPSAGRACNLVHFGCEPGVMG